MSSRVASWLAWSLSMLCVAMFLTIVALYDLIRSTPQEPSSVSTRFTLTDLLIGVPFLASTIMGALIASSYLLSKYGPLCRHLTRTVELVVDPIRIDWLYLFFVWHQLVRS